MQLYCRYNMPLQIRCIIILSLSCCSSDRNVRVCERTLELLVFSESFLSRAIVGGSTVSSEYNLASRLQLTFSIYIPIHVCQIVVADCIFYSVCDDRVLHYVATAGNGAFSYVFKYLRSDSVSRAIHRSPHRCSNERGGNDNDKIYDYPGEK